MKNNDLSLEKKDDFGFFCLILVFIIVSTLVFLLGTTIPIKTDKPINPEIQINIKNGISDTTYIYHK